MPELNPSPKIPTTDSPYLSPNPKIEEGKLDGGRGTPVIVETAPKEQIDPTEESAEIDALRTYVNEELAKKENLSNKVTAIGANPGDVKYPTEKAVADYVQTVVLGAIERSY